jgi:putative hydroxymethylpyrimidine transport system substrate-binding protein
MIKKILLTACMMFAGIGSAQANDQVKVLLDWFVNPDHAPIIVAQAIGAFKEAGLDVQVVQPADPSMPPRLLAANQADIALSYQPQLYLLQDKGLPVIRVGTLINSPLNSITAIEGSGIHSVKDFKGRKIGYSVSGVEDVMVKNMLQHNGVNPHDVQLVNINFQVITALLSHQVDGAIAFRNLEAIELKEKGATPIIFKPEENGTPAYDELIFLANENHVHDAKIKKFLLAVEKGVAYMKAHPEQAWELFIKQYPALSNSLNRDAWHATLPLFASDPSAFDKTRYEVYGDYMLKNKLISNRKPAESYGVDPTR